MRGKERYTTAFNNGSRITPAYAGKRHSQLANLEQKWDHPRLCGEKNPHAGEDEPAVGSPPPMRGKACGRTDL